MNNAPDEPKGYEWGMPFDMGPEDGEQELELDQTEATCDWFDHHFNRGAGDDVCVLFPSESLAPILSGDRYWEESPQYWDRKAEIERRKEFNE